MAAEQTSSRLAGVAAEQMDSSVCAAEEWMDTSEQVHDFIVRSTTKTNKSSIVIDLLSAQSVSTDCADNTDYVSITNTAGHNGEYNTTNNHNNPDTLSSTSDNNINIIMGTASVYSTPVAERYANTQDGCDAVKAVTRSARKGPLTATRVFQDPPARHSPRLAAIARALRGGSARSNSAGRSLGGSGAALRARRCSAHATAPTTASTPSRHGNRGPLTPSEQLQLSSMCRVRRSSTPAIVPSPSRRPSSSTKVLTRPVAFHFATDARANKSTAAADGTTDVAKEVSAADFARKLRHNAAASSCAAAASKGPCKPTKPQSLNLSEATKSKAVTAGSQQPFFSLDELNMKFHSHTPQRLKDNIQRKVREEEEGRGGGGEACGGLAQPQSSSTTSHLLEEHLHHPDESKAVPMDAKVFEGPKFSQTVPKKPAAAACEPLGFKQAKQEKQQEVAGGRNKMGSLLQLLGADHACVVASSLPHSGMSHLVARRPTTRPRPFSFHDRDQSAARKKQDKIDQVVVKKKDVAEFQAAPMPLFSSRPQGLPGKQVPLVTKPKAFNLALDKRTADKKQRAEKAEVQQDAAAPVTGERRATVDEVRRVTVRAPLQVSNQATLPPGPHFNPGARLRATSLTRGSTDASLRTRGSTDASLRTRGPTDASLRTRGSTDARSGNKGAADASSRGKGATAARLRASSRSRGAATTSQASGR